MPQQPKITGDAQVDSWSLQVTQELNAANTSTGGGVQGVPIVDELPNVTNGTIGELVSLTTGDGEFEPDVYRRIANNGVDEDWDLVGRANAPVPVIIPERTTLTEALTYRMAFVAAATNHGRSNNCVGFAPDNTPTIFTFIPAGSEVSGNMTSAGIRIDTSGNRYGGVADNTIDPGDTADFSNIPMTFPTQAEYRDFAALVGGGSNQGWAFYTGTELGGGPVQFGIKFPRPAIINAANPIRESSWPITHPYIPIVATGPINMTVRVVGITDPTFDGSVTITVTDPTVWSDYTAGGFFNAVVTTSGSRQTHVNGNIGTTGGLGINAPNGPMVAGDSYEVFVTVGNTFDTAGQNFPAVTLPSYTEGDWTPGLRQLNGGNFNPSQTSGRFVRDRNLVHFSGTLVLPNTSASQGNAIRITNLPFPVEDEPGGLGNVTVARQSTISVGGADPELLRLELVRNTDEIQILGINGNTPLRGDRLTNSTIVFGGSYITSGA